MVVFSSEPKMRFVVELNSDVFGDNNKFILITKVLSNDVSEAWYDRAVNISYLYTKIGKGEKLTDNENKKRRQLNKDILDFMLEQVIGWENVSDENGKDIPFTKETFCKVCETYCGFAAMCFTVYLSKVRNPAKN